MPDGRPPARSLRIDVPIDDPDDPRLLRGALLRARATELADLQRRDARLSFGYGTDSAREGMNAEVAQHRRRIELLDRLLAALETAGADTEV
jgi:hypothetical protein